MILFIPVGIPGCGKSSFAESFGVPFIVSTDEIRKELTGDMTNQDANGEVFKRFHHRIDTGLGIFNVYADATNLTSDARSELRKIAYDARAQTHVIVFRNLREAIARNNARDRKVPAEVMLRMVEKYEETMLNLPYEPYDYITEVSAVN